MAVKYQEAQILGGGIKYDRPTKGSFALNMLRRHGAWEVREGFGQLAELDSMLPFSIGTYTRGTDRTYGYTKHLGSHVLKTDFGHTQILSVFKARSFTDEASELLSTDPTYGAEIIDSLMVSVYDVITGERWDEPIYRHTSALGFGRGDMQFRHGNYETTRTEATQSWVSAASEDPFFFAEVGDAVYFGSPTTPLHAYSPASFHGARLRSVASFREGTHGSQLRPEWNRPYSESSMVRPVRPTQGQYTEKYEYRTASSLPNPKAMTTFDGALVLGNGRVLYFSNIFQPAVFIARNVVTVPSEEEIVALGTSGQNIYIFTSGETWMYAPGSSPLIGIGAAPIRISDSVGCVSQGAVTKFGEALMWVSQTGVHVLSGGFDIQTISGPIAPLFTDFITDPATTFFTATTANTGATDLGTAQRNSVVTFDYSGINVTYCQHLEALFITLPGQRLSLCFSDGQWSLWSYESNTAEYATSYLSVPTVEKNIASPWLLSIDDKLLLVGSVQVELFGDSAQTAGAPVGSAPNWSDGVYARSYYILEYGRGGAIDRSVDDEDGRIVAGKYRIDWTNAGGGRTAAALLVLDKWIKVTPGYKFWGTTATSEPQAPSGESAPSPPEETWLIPVKIMPSSASFTNPTTGNAIENLEITFKFDNTNWQPIFTTAATTDIDIILPPERMASREAWTVMKCQDSAAAFAPDRDGDTINLIWDGSTGTWSGNGNHKPNKSAPNTGGMNVAPYRLNTLCYIPMKTRSAPAFPSGLSQMGIISSGPGGTTPYLALINNAAVPVTLNGSGYIWQQWARFPRHREDVQGIAGTDLIAQPVDWAYMSPDIGLDSDVRLKLRGVAATMMSRGQGTDVTGSWTQGIFNTLLAADLKTWMAQVVDYIGGALTFTRPVSIKTNIYPTNAAGFVDETVRDRIPGAAPVKRAEFDGGVKWGNEAVAFESDSCLIGDEQVDTIVTSDSVKGTSVSTMLFGFMRNPAERLKLQSVQALLRAVGASRRRTGR
jgi:hypothetical protein